MNDTDDETGEERVGGNLNKVDDVVEKVANKLADEMEDDIPSLVKIFEKWKRLSVEAKFTTPEGLMLAKASNDRFMKIFKLYGLFNFLGEAAFIQRLEGIKANKIKAAAQK
ncbi:hypothetical protein JG687_00007637 [Phytophthora cactorum]|uniref:Uncharacterized protein n=1 Tax=Phytophthora cactorum TaxID=29920 RepID=A0A8T1UEN4_9STRA|nr:hypothetical protein PC120_g13368 [Phytophthora cactorum]KAG3059475.1 hypothetical protein PC121_g13928 [Phytophthora cactorum]KAG6961573.1 hypothetical protein JG687_00007637 [Phytophthora cactorum]